MDRLDFTESRLRTRRDHSSRTDDVTKKRLSVFHPAVMIRKFPVIPFARHAARKCAATLSRCYAPGVFLAT
ncbi:hypothetical protein GRAN_1250 [Granulicella sibirica]|uniref:Uncharacterized protein n=1 Tax=Granulicella sibirica TaxID=2479048 RepID=A0A4Q0T5N6_9BACT|nr:hypothetical protein GRAN_1250 [Granulicella sibirica]